MEEKLQKRLLKHYHNMNAFIQDCIKANKQIYEYIHTHMSSTDIKATGKIGFGGDDSLTIDLKAESIFINHLNKYGNIYSEESGYISSNKKINIIIDPIDGSDNLASNLPYYGTSVALEENNKIIAAVICNLATGIISYKTKDSGIEKLELKTLKPINNFKIENSKFGVFERAYTHPKLCQKLFNKNIKYRSLGAIALSLCDARNYKFILFHGSLRQFDIAAGVFMCEELNLYQNDEFLIVAKSIYDFNLIKDTINKL
jgi:myo-inositol-1(or 4)-monophosphatase